MADVIILALVLVQLTTADGAKVMINPEFVAKLYQTKEAAERKPNTLVTPGARCVVVTGDGKFISVREECDYVQMLLEKKR